MTTLALNWNGSRDNTPVTLTSLMGDKTVPAITLTVAPHTTLTIIDDLTSFDTLDQSSSSTIEFVLHAHSKLFYSMKLAPKDISLYYANKPAVELVVVDTNDTVVFEKNITIRFVGEHSHAELISSCFATGNRVFKFKTLQDHAAEHTSSNIVVRTVLDDTSKVFCNGMIRVDKKGQRTDAELLYTSILLSKNARVVAIPQLEIEADDVKCKHGAAMSRLNAEQIFYMQSRGIDEVSTKQLLIQGFLG